MRPTDVALGTSCPRVSCGPLPEFDVASLEAVRLSFISCVPVALRQAWLARPADGFATAQVRTGWMADSLWVFAELDDVDIHSLSRALNERMWELGDSFEIFLQAAGRESYAELQVTPNNHRLQLRFADDATVARARQTGDFAPVFLPGAAFSSRVWQQAGRWSVLAGIPLALVDGFDGPAPGREWRFSFSRYDYTRGVTEPVISSTSAHAVPDFHRRHEWGRMNFVAGAVESPRADVRHQNTR